MFDDENVIQNEVVENETNEVQEPQVQAESVQSVQKTSPQESFSKLRESKDKAIRERDEAYRLLKQYEDNKAPQQVVSDDSDDDIGLESEDYAHGKHLSKVDKKVKKLEQQLKQYQQQSSAMTVEARILSQFPDYSSVVSDDNIAQLREEFPEMAQTLHSSTDFYSKAVSTYKLIKKLGISPDSTYDNEKAVVQRNASKPRSVASIAPQQSDSPLTKANAFQNGLTEELKSSLHKEMMLAIRQGR
jgi:hypothetical protein